MNNRPLDTLTWRKGDLYIKIEKTIHRTTFINPTTGKEEFSIEQVADAPPIKRRRARKRK
jgi:hypothetical protein